jgi:hypothetical protein
VTSFKQLSFADLKISFLAVFSGLVARQDKFSCDEIEHGGHVVHCPFSSGLVFHNREQAVESLHEDGRQS